MGALGGRIALITGASRGIGAAVAERFAAEGARLILAARTAGGLEEVDDRIAAASEGAKATLIPVDLADHDRIDEMAGAIADRFGRLDILVGNAAVLGGLAPLAHVEPERWAEAMNVNLTANWRLIRAFEPLLRRSPAGRAIFVTSGVTRETFPYWGPYAASKAALEALVRTWAAELDKTDIRVNLLSPGVVRTRMRAEAMPGEDPTTLPPPESVAGLFVELASEKCRRNGETVFA
ncbi:MAG: SDR family NAD(P)-dependent oxidoreductase [Rhodospirillaceae bacterium]|nr:SDR family NAD(P)-dependent oxidoreductase [Rhodospirillaceae bacterium]MYF85583.1 SDR family NAD(P)-dependent oxidoreductase [Rhodospirillaceae bacterium]MYH36143.1 SDR family NAD(P)-dependent oxidoreductase [Rhodospirillaceae bacterium]MYK15002.1 SDR family NAD(P)-dependent oxidoreductase [Rhodospirillaceae bacterium]